MTPFSTYELVLIPLLPLSLMLNIVAVGRINFLKQRIEFVKELLEFRIEINTTAISGLTKLVGGSDDETDD